MVDACWRSCVSAAKSTSRMTETGSGARFPGPAASASSGLVTSSAGVLMSSAGAVSSAGGGATSSVGGSRRRVEPRLRVGRWGLVGGCAVSSAWSQFRQPVVRLRQRVGSPRAGDATSSMGGAVSSAGGADSSAGRRVSSAGRFRQRARFRRAGERFVGWWRGLDGRCSRRTRLEHVGLEEGANSGMLVAVIRCRRHRDRGGIPDPLRPPKSRPTPGRDGDAVSARCRHGDKHGCGRLGRAALIDHLRRTRKQARAQHEAGRRHQQL